MAHSKRTAATILLSVSLLGSSALAAGLQQINPDAYVTIGGATGMEDAGRVRVDATAGASIMITPDQNYEPASYPLHEGRRVPDNLHPVPPAAEAIPTARAVIRGERTDFGLNTNASKNGTAVGANVRAKGSYAAAFGNGANVKAEDGLALGHKTSVTADNSVALGAGSIVTTANTVSVGSDLLVRKVTNVADGMVAYGSHDAVTGGQLYALNQKIDALIKENEALKEEIKALRK